MTLGLVLTFRTVPLPQPPSDQFRGFDDEANNLMSGLHLDADDEPRRGLGANSRANSVRFDESANQNHFSHSSRPSMDFMSRTNSSGLGGLQMSERSSSHKSEGRASSAHSMRSAASGRANSLNLDTGYHLGESNRSPLDTPALAPGLLLLGAVPAIIRCWMNTNFKHDALLYAAVCTGSYKSYLDLRLIEKLGFEDSVVGGKDGTRTVELPVYFPEAIPHPASSRSSSPAPQLPTLTVNFQVVDHVAEHEAKAIQIFIGSDVLRSHSADILLSSNSMTLYDDEQSKLSIPLVRPEDEKAFKSLYVSTGTPHLASRPQSLAKDQTYFNGLGQGSSAASVSSAAASPPPGKYRPPGAVASDVSTTESAKAGAAVLVADADADVRPLSRASNTSRPSLSTLNTRAEASEPPAMDLSAQSTPLRTGSSPAIWSNWRREGTAPTASQPASTSTSGLDWANAGKNRETSYQRKESGIKVLKPKTVNRSVSSTTAPTTPAAQPMPAPPSAGGSGGMGDGRSRFFDEGRRRDGPEVRKENAPPSAIGTTAPAPGTAKTKANPIGGASAFSWLNPGGSK